MKSVNKRRLARLNSRDQAKLIAVQERQIAAMQAQIEALDSILLAVAELYIYDHVDPCTGEVCKGWQING